MEAKIDPQIHPKMNPNQLLSDMDTIKGVLSETEKRNDTHRIIIAAGNLFLALVLLIAVPVLLLVPGIVIAASASSEASIVSLAMLIPITILCIVATPSLLAGWGLIRRKSWGNVWAVISAILNIANIPLGTALAIYTFWALTQKKLVAKD